MSFRRATATVLISMGVAAAVMEACAASDPNPATTRGTGTGTGTGSGTGGGTGSGAGGGTGSGGTTTTGGGGTVGPINPGNPEAGADMRVTADAACAGQETEGKLKQTDLLMMVDSSGSMTTVDPGQTATRWANLTQAIPPFVNDMANAGMMIGLDFFPEGQPASCNATDYQNLNVPIGVIPGMGNMQAMAISSAVTARMPANGTPTVAALTGALTVAKTWQMQNPDRSLNVLFMTDGEPQGCQGNNVAAASAVAQMYSNGMPPIKTFVLGVGPDTGPLDMIAAAGGTRMAYMVTNGGAAELSKALADIRKSGSLGCDYVIPKGDGGAVDYTKITVRVKVGGTGTPEEIPNVVNANGCAGNPMNPMGLGWYYDNPPPAVPTKITLCPNSCGPLQVSSGSVVSILLGCVPKIIPPPN